MLIGKTFHFDSAHYLKDHPHCGHIHGHTWQLTVALEGPIDLTTGMVADFKRLSNLVKEHILDRLDHTLINQKLGLDYPTCEYLAIWIAETLARVIPEPITNVLITLQEGEGGWAHYEHTIR
jgi:6-pyruvoyltetrahydropterin/6-carboxytetrahydropterin synthase